MTPSNFPNQCPHVKPDQPMQGERCAMTTHTGPCTWVRPETQRDIDARQAAAYSTSSEHAGFDLDDVRRMYRGAI